MLDLFFNCPQTLGLDCAGVNGPNGQRRVGASPTYPGPDCMICPNATELKEVERAIADGVITWHAYPQNSEPELADKLLLLDGIASVHRLDARFNQSRKTVISQRDVPGVTRGIVPLMAKSGVKAFSEGCNAQIQPPQVPGPIFNWTDRASSSSIIMMLHPRGYGVSEGVAAYSSGYAKPDPERCFNFQGHGDWSIHDVVTVAGFNEALVYAFKSDNQGPPDADEVHQMLNCTAMLFPAGAELYASTFDSFIHSLLEHPTAAKSLPVFDGEIGDTWIYGAQADPKKMKMLRLIMRERSACIKSGACIATDVAIANSTRLLLKATEHTFGLHGLDGPKFGPNSTTWDNAAHRKTLAKGNNSTTSQHLRLWEDSWVEQRLYTGYALEALTAEGTATAMSKKLAASIRAATAAAAPQVPVSHAGFKEVATDGVLRSTQFDFVVHGTTGGLSSLRSVASGKELVDKTSGYDLVQYVYRSRNQASDFTAFRHNFTGDWQTFPGTWFTQQPGGCYDKEGLDNATCAAPMGCAKSQDWLPTSVDVYAKNNAQGKISDLIVEMTLPKEGHALYGAPTKVWVSISFSEAAATLNADVTWQSKSSTRLPEESLVAFPFAPCSAAAHWEVDKLGSWIDPRNVVPAGGASHLHAVGDGGARRVCPKDGTLKVVGLDSALLSISRASAFPTPATPLGASEANAGVYAVLHDNYWDVNYPLWYPYGKFTKADADEKFRFTLSLK